LGDIGPVDPKDLQEEIRRNVMMELSEYQEAGRRLIEKLRLYTDPVGIKYIRDIAEIPERARRPSARGQK
jgi:uncharacterized protein (DUF169 family)